jgi:hypothetical protein
VRVANDHPNGFYFDPTAIVALESAGVEMQTTIFSIARDPESYAPGGGGGQETWVVPASLLAIETSEPLQCSIVPACDSF